VCVCVCVYERARGSVTDDSSSLLCIALLTDVTGYMTFNIT